MNIVNVGYASTNYYLLADERPRLLIDVGFPGTLPKLQHNCQRMDVDLKALPYLLCTHYHPDHAGLAQELRQFGVKLIVLDEQRAAVSQFGSILKPEYGYVEIDLAVSVPLTAAASRAFLAENGIAGEILATPGHSDDSVSLILDEGIAFTGDLPRPLPLDDEAMRKVAQSWALLRAHGVKTVYPGHGGIGKLPQ